MGATTGNTFSVQLVNPTSQATSVSLFRQGYAPSTSFIPRNLRIATFADSSFFDSASMSLVRNCVFRVYTNVTSILLFDSGTIIAGTSLDEINARFAQAGFVTPQPSGAFVRLYLNNDNLIVMQCVGMTFNFTNLAEVNDGTGDFVLLGNQNDHILSSFSSAEILNDSYNYNELMATQTGSPMQIVALDIDTNNTLQFSSPIEYARYDANGNVRGQAALGLIDPYQYQTVHLVNIPLDGLVFDGNSQFNYVVSAFTDVKLTFRYVFAAEGMLFAQAIRQQIIDQYRQAQQDMIDLSSGLKKELIL